MKAIKSRRALWAMALTSAVVIAAAIGGFIVARELGGESGAKAKAPQDRPPLWYVPILEAEAQKPRLVQTINGMTVGPVDTAFDASKCVEPANDFALSTADGTALQVRPSYLPPGAVAEGGRSVRCGTFLGLATADYSVPANQAAGQFGGWITITREVLSKPTVYLNLPAEHFAPGVIAGRGAVFVSPPTPESFGEAAIVVKEDFGATVIQSRGLTLAELVKVAQSLY